MPLDFSDLKAMFVNCTLKKSPERSHTQGLADKSIAIMQANGVAVDVVRAVDHDIATGVYPDMAALVGDRRVARAVGADHGGRHPW